MTDTTIKVSQENKDFLAMLAQQLSKERGTKHGINAAITELRLQYSRKGK